MVLTEERRFQSLGVNLDSDHIEPANSSDGREHGPIHLLAPFSGVLTTHARCVPASMYLVGRMPLLQD